MPTRSDETRDPDRPETVTMARDDMRLQRMRVREELLSAGAVSRETKRVFAERIIEFFDELRENDDTIDNSSGVPEITDTKAARLEQLSWETATVSRTLNRAHNPTVAETVPKVVTIDARELIDASLELDKVANALGLGTSAEGSTHRAEIGDDLLEEVEEWRQQKLES